MGKIAFTYISQVVMVVFTLLGLNLRAQEKKSFDSIPFLERVDSLNSEGKLELELIPITKKEFNAYSKSIATIVKFDSIAQKNNSESIRTKNSEFAFKNVGELAMPFTYGGFIPFLNCHLVYYCKEICEDYLLDHQTDQMMFIPTSYDQGVLGMPFSPLGKKWMVYSSYDGPEFEDYYNYRAEIFIYKIEPNKGLSGIHFYGSYFTQDWSIEDAFWVDENTIALKIYSENRWGDGRNVNYSYFTAKIDSL